MTTKDGQPKRKGRFLEWLEKVNGSNPEPSMRRDPFSVREIVPDSPNSVRTGGPSVREITPGTPNSVRN